MKWHANPVINEAVRALEAAVMSELAAGRCDVGAWRLMLLEGTDVRTAGAGCDCPSCTALLREAVLNFSDSHACPERLARGQAAAG